jgi:hypothetical protein
MLLFLFRINGLPPHGESRPRWKGVRAATDVGVPPR